MFQILYQINSVNLLIERVMFRKIITAADSGLHKTTCVNLRPTTKCKTFPDILHTIEVSAKTLSGNHHCF